MQNLAGDGTPSAGRHAVVIELADRVLTVGARTFQLRVVVRTLAFIVGVARAMSQPMSWNPSGFGTRTSTPSYLPGLYVTKALPVESITGLGKFKELPPTSTVIAGSAFPLLAAAATQPTFGPTCLESRTRNNRTVPRDGCGTS